MQDRLEDSAKQGTPQAEKHVSMVITPSASIQRGDPTIHSTSSITSTLDGTVESRISSLESLTEQTNKTLQDMMKMMEKLTKKEENTKRGQLPKEVVTTTEQYKDKSARGEEGE
jgi:hypothetical protein